MKRVLLFLAEGFDDIEAGAITEVMGWTRVGWTRLIDGIEEVEVVTAGFREKVHSKHGLVVNPQLLIEDVAIAEYDALVLPGGFWDNGYREVYDRRLLEVTKEVYDSGGIIATMCVGALPVAKAGLLKGRKATTYPHSMDILKKAGAIPVSDKVVVEDRIITCSGPAFSLEVAFLLLEMLGGSKAVNKVKEAMICKQS